MDNKILRQLLLIILILITAVACTRGPNPKDPYESYNRLVYGFNKGLDEDIINPVVKTYRYVLPFAIRNRVTNFFSNLNEVPTFVNSVLQARWVNAISSGWRFVVNSTFGIGGMFDVATTMGLTQHPQDFGLTLAAWGWKNSTYTVVPVFGPSTFRDSIGFTFDFFTNSLYAYIKPFYVRVGLLALYYVNVRSDLVEAEKLIKTAAFDPYSFERDAFLQRRNFQINRNMGIEEDTYVEDEEDTDFDSKSIDTTPDKVSAIIIERKHALLQKDFSKTPITLTQAIVKFENAAKARELKGLIASSQVVN